MPTDNATNRFIVQVSKSQERACPLFFSAKTEKEYYSRTVREKVAALANPELHRLAQKLMDY